MIEGDYYGYGLISGFILGVIFTRLYYKRKENEKLKSIGKDNSKVW